MRLTWALVVPILSLLAIAASPASAWWPSVPVAGLPISTAANEQLYPAIVSDGVGGAFIFWQDLRTLDNDIYAQHVNFWGEVHWAPDGAVVCGVAGVQSYVRVASDDAFGAVVAWVDYRSGNWDVYAQRMSYDGNPLWTPGGVAVISAADGQFNHEIIADGSGGAIVAFVDDSNGLGDWNIRAQRIDGSGTVIWAAGGMPVCEALGDQNSPAMAADGTGGAVIVWIDNRNGVDWDIYAQRISAAGNGVWSAGGVTVCAASGDQLVGGIVGDGSGGAVIVWRDERGGTTDVYAQRIDSWGTEVWATDGTPIRATGDEEFSPVLIGAAAGGATIAWLDTRASAFDIDVYAQRVDGLGNELWTAGGVPVCSVPTPESNPVILDDDAGGAIIAWIDSRAMGTVTEIYTQRLDGGGNPLWVADGVLIASSHEMLGDQVLATDTAGGAIVGWLRGNPENNEGDIYAQHIGRHGNLGIPAPLITEIIDYPADQGGKVIVTWTASYLDSYPREVVTHYSIWRRLESKAPDKASGIAGSECNVAVVSEHSGLDQQAVENFARSGWSYVGQTPASYWYDYGYDAPTYVDSTAAGNPLTWYMIVAQTDDPWMFWESPPAGGYSVDNLAPGAPLALAAQAVYKDVELNWSASDYRDEDLAVYNIHRSAAPGFVPDGSTFLAAAVDTFLTDSEPGGGIWYYLVIAEDIHGNLSGPSNEASADVLSGLAGPAVPGVFALVGCHPNPFNPVTQLAFDVPDGGGHVQLGVFDVTGRLVRVLVDDWQEAGRRSARWYGTDDSGRPVASGVYYGRMLASGYARTIKMTLLK